MKWGLGYLSWTLSLRDRRFGGCWGQPQNHWKHFSHLSSVHPSQQTGQVLFGNFQANLIPTHFQDERQARGTPERNQETVEAVMCRGGRDVLTAK